MNVHSREIRRAPTTGGPRPRESSIFSVGSVALSALAIAGILGGIVHLTLGERFILQRLAVEQLPVSFLGDGRVTKGYLRWFWHVGTLAIVGGSAAVGAVAVGIAGAPPLLASTVGVFFLGIFAAFLVVALPRPQLFLRIPQGALLGLGGLLIVLVAAA